MKVTWGGRKTNYVLAIWSSEHQCSHAHVASGEDRTKWGSVCWYGILPTFQ